MKLYLDADIFLALIKENDRYKESAQKFFNTHKEHAFVTSSLTCLEIWFYLHKHGMVKKVLGAIKSITALASVIGYGMREVESAIILAEQRHLTPADAIHAVLASEADAIVSSDASFDSVSGLKKINFVTL